MAAQSAAITTNGRSPGCLVGWTGCASAAAAAFGSTPSRVPGSRRSGRCSAQRETDVRCRAAGDRVAAACFGPRAPPESRSGQFAGEALRDIVAQRRSQRLVRTEHNDEPTLLPCLGLPEHEQRCAIDSIRQAHYQLPALPCPGFLGFPVDRIEVLEAVEREAALPGSIDRGEWA